MTETPARTALIAAHGQPSAPEPPEAALAELARAVSRHLPGWRVASATIASPGRLEATREALAENTLLYPLFMSPGFFVRRVLPERLGDRLPAMTDPLGLAPALPRLAADLLRDACAARGWTPAETTLLLAAHGSARGRAAAQATEEFARALRARMPGTEIRTGYVEEAPRIAEAARDMGARAICLPFFAQAGDHVRHDIPEGLDAAGFTGLRLVPLGLAPGIPRLIAETLRAHPG